MEYGLEMKVLYEAEVFLIMEKWKLLCPFLEALWKWSLLTMTAQ